MITLTATAHCNGCTWTTGPDQPTTVDRAADKHTRDTGHPTATITTNGGNKTSGPPTVPTNAWTVTR